MICGKDSTAQNIQTHFRVHHASRSYRGQCVVCQNEVSLHSNKFCSRSCAAIKSNSLKDFTKFKSGPQKGTQKKALYTKISQCPICGKWHPFRNTCSLDCKRILTSNSIKLAIQNGYGPGGNRGRGKSSYLESSFEFWLSTNFPDLVFIREYAFKRSDVRKTYFADFYFPSLKLVIELDGSQHQFTKKYDSERDSFIKSQYGVEVVRISHNEYKRKTRIQEIWSLLGESNPGHHVGSVGS